MSQKDWTEMLAVKEALTAEEISAINSIRTTTPEDEL